MRRLLAMMLLLLSLLLSACGRGETNFFLYCPVENLKTAAGKGAIEVRSIEIERPWEMDTIELSEALLNELLATNIAPGVELSSVSVEGRRLDVDFSRHYANLTDIDLTLVDYCVTLTLTQLENINSVTITAGGRMLPQRRERILTAADPLLGPTEDTLRPVEVELYFWDNETEALVAVERTLELHEGQSRVDAVLAELVKGTEITNMSRSVPETLEVISARVEEGVCYLYITGVDSLSASASEAIKLSVESLPIITEVRIALDSTSTGLE